MANEFKHKAVGGELTQLEWEDVLAHQFDSQASGDILYASSVTQLSRLATLANAYLKSGTPPVWRTYAELKTDLGFNTTARAYQNVSQNLKSATLSAIMFDTEVWDTGGDFDNRVLTATADATEALKLHDADGGFEAGDVGATIWNTTDNTYALVTAFVDAGELTLDTDIMVNGEGYKLFRSWFVCPADGKYLVCGSLGLDSPADTVAIICAIYVNATLDSRLQIPIGAAFGTIHAVSAVIDCSTNDKIQLYGYQSSGGIEAVSASSSTTWLSVHRLS